MRRRYRNALSHSSIDAKREHEKSYSLVLGLGTMRVFGDVLHGLGGMRSFVGVAGALGCVAGGVVLGLVDAL